MGRAQARCENALELGIDEANLEDGSIISVRVFAMDQLEKLYGGIPLFSSKNLGVAETATQYLSVRNSPPILYVCVIWMLRRKAFYSKLTVRTTIFT